MGNKSSGVGSIIQTRINKANSKVVVCGLITVLVGVLFLDYIFVTQKQFGTMSNLTAKISEMQKNIKMMEDHEEQRIDYEDQLNNFEIKLKGINLKLNHREHVPTILEKISRIAHHNNIVVDQIMPLLDEQTVLLKKDGYVYYALPVMIRAKGGYHNFGMFLNLLESDQTSFEPVEFSVHRKDLESSNTIRVVFNTVVFEKEIKSD